MGYQGGDMDLVLVSHAQQKTEAWDGVSARVWRWCLPFSS